MSKRKLLKKGFDYESKLEELIEDIVSSGMDPDYFVTKNGKSTGEKAIVYVL